MPVTPEPEGGTGKSSGQIAAELAASQKALREKRGGRRRVTSAEVEYRIRCIQSWVCDGASFGTILKMVASERAKDPNSWQINERGIRQAMDVVRERIKGATEKDIRYQFAMAERRLNDLYLLAKGKGDYATARAVVKDLRELYGLDRNRKVRTEVTGKDGAPIEVKGSPDWSRLSIEELRILSKAGALSGPENPDVGQGAVEEGDSEGTPPP